MIWLQICFSSFLIDLAATFSIYPMIHFFLLRGGLSKLSIHSCTDTVCLFLTSCSYFQRETTATRLKNEMLRDPPEGRGRAGNEGAWPCAPSAEDSEPGRCRSSPHRGTSDSQRGDTQVNNLNTPRPNTWSLTSADL